MKTLNFPFQKTALATVLTLALVSCLHDSSSGNNNKDNNTGGSGTQIDDTKNYFLVVDGEGYVNIYKDNGASTIPAGNFKLSATAGVTLGEIHFHNGRAFVAIQSGLKDANNVDIGGGVAIIDMKTALANPGGDVTTFVKIVPLTATKVPGPTRIVHTYMDPDGKHLWLNNDGPRNPNTPEDASATPGSAFVINWDHPTVMDLAAYATAITGSIEEIALGNGHKKSAFSRPSGAPNTPLVFATHNLSDQTVSVIDNNPMNTTSFRSVLKTVDLKTSTQIDDGNGGQRNKNNSPHGMIYSISSRRFYTGITSGEDMALAIIDPENDNALTSIPVATDPSSGQVPASGYVQASHDGVYIYTVGYKNNQGYLSVILAMAGVPDTVHQVVALGDLSASDLDISHMEHPSNGIVAHHVTLLVPGGYRKASNMNARVAVLEFDHDTGKLMNCADAFCDVTKIKYLEVGATRAEHRNGGITSDATRAVYPNADCKTSDTTQTDPILLAEDTVDCKTINVIDVMSGTVTKLATAGRGPSAVGILSKAALEDTSSGGDHTTH